MARVAHHMYALTTLRSDLLGAFFSPSVAMSFVRWHCQVQLGKQAPYFCQTGRPEQAAPPTKLHQALDELEVQLSSNK